jgi:hypothetical protein
VAWKLAPARPVQAGDDCDEGVRALSAVMAAQEDKLEACPTWSFVPQRENWIHSRRAQRWYGAGCQGDTTQ